MLLLAQLYGVRGFCLSCFRFAAAAAFVPVCLCALALSFLPFLSPMGFVPSWVAWRASPALRPTNRVATECSDPSRPKAEQASAKRSAWMPRAHLRFGAAITQGESPYVQGYELEASLSMNNP